MNYKVQGYASNGSGENGNSDSIENHYEIFETKAEAIQFLNEDGGAEFMNATISETDEDATA